jgi:hypothetical protein
VKKKYQEAWNVQTRLKEWGSKIKYNKKRG